MYIDGWKQNASKCYWIKKGLEHFCIHPFDLKLASRDLIVSIFHDSKRYIEYIYMSTHSWNKFSECYKQASDKLYKVSWMSFIEVYIKMTTSVTFLLSHGFLVPMDPPLYTSLQLY